MKTTHYNQLYLEKDQYWSREISKMALKILDMFPADKGQPKVLDIGCGEGANAIFLAKNGYKVSAFDLSTAAIEKTKAAAKENEVEISVKDQIKWASCSTYFCS